MKNISIITFCFFIASNILGQTIEELYEANDYQGLAWLEGKTNKTTINGNQAYMFAFAFFQTENDSKAVEYFDEAIKKGYDSLYVHFYKSVCSRYLKKFNDAHQEIDFCIQAKPGYQKFRNEKGLIYLAQNQYNLAIEQFEIAKESSNNYFEPYYWVAYTYLQKKDEKSALKAFYTAKEKIIPQNRFYLLSLTGIGQLEYSFSRNIQQSITAFKEALTISPQNHELLLGLIKAYNAQNDSTKSDSLFAIIKTSFENGELPKEIIKAQNIIVSEFSSKSQTVIIRKHLQAPKNKRDLLFKIFLMDKSGELIERKFEVLQASESGTSPKFSLVETDKTGKEIPTSYHWTNEKISIKTIENSIRLLIEGSGNGKQQKK